MSSGPELQIGHWPLSPMMCDEDWHARKTYDMQYLSLRLCHPFIFVSLLFISQVMLWAA
jgi:hypothetical protein